MQKQKINKRKNRVRLHIRAVSDRPRLSVIRTNAHIWVQLIDDTKGLTLAATSSKTLGVKGTKTEVATKVGEKIAELALANKVKKITFDRGAYRYHGRIKALAEGARKAGLNF